MVFANWGQGISSWLGPDTSNQIFRRRQVFASTAPCLLSGTTRQVLREYLAAMTRPQTWESLTEAMADVTAFADRFGMLEDGSAVWNQLFQLSRHYAFAGRQVHDANMVATTIAHGEHRLLTFNTGEFQRFAAVVELITL